MHRHCAQCILAALAFVLLSATNRPNRKHLQRQQSQGGFWRVDHTFTPLLHINNLLHNVPITVTPMLYMADGTEYDLEPVMLAAAGVATIDIRDVLLNAPPEVQVHISEYGTAAIKYEWQWSAVAGTIQNLDARRSLNFNYPLHARLDMGHSQLQSPTDMGHQQSASIKEGMWWKEDMGVTGFLGLMNTSSTPQQVQVDVLSGVDKVPETTTLLIEPNHTRKVDILQTNDSAVGGIRVSHFGSNDDLMVVGGLENPSEGYSAGIPFLFTAADKRATSVNKATKVSVSSVGLMTGTLIQ
jgi:hypothetical protein